MAQRITHYDIDDYWTPRASFTVGGAATDPTTLIVDSKDADGTITNILTSSSPAALLTSSSPVKRVSAGVYELNPGTQLTKAGYWFTKFKGTGAAAASEEQVAIVDPSEFNLSGGLSVRALVGLAETKDWLQQQNISTESDLELVRVINDVSDRMAYEAAREFKVAASAVRNFDIAFTGKSSPRYIDGTWIGDYDDRNRTIRIGDLSAAPTLVRIMDEDWVTPLETVTSGNYSTLPLVRESWEPIRELRFRDSVTALGAGMRVELTGTWGFPAVPGNVRQAVLDSVAQIMDRDVEHYSQDSGTISGSVGAGEGGNVIVVGGGRQRLLSLPPSALAVAWSYRDTWLG